MSNTPDSRHFPLSSSTVFSGSPAFAHWVFEGKWHSWEESYHSKAVIIKLICKAETGTKTENEQWIPGEEEAWDELGDWDWHLYITMSKREN